jgi:hypothetical protein
MDNNATEIQQDSLEPKIPQEIYRLPIRIAVALLTLALAGLLSLQLTV